MLESSFRAMFVFYLIIMSFSKNDFVITSSSVRLKFAHPFRLLCDEFDIVSISKSLNANWSQVDLCD